MADRHLKDIGRLAAATLILLVVAAPARAIIPVFVETSSSNNATLGLVSATAVSNGAPSFIDNGFIMTSPGQGYPLANYNVPGLFSQSGSSSSFAQPLFLASGPVNDPPFGTFGGGAISAPGGGFGFSLSDANTPGTAESYINAFSTTTYTVTGNFPGTLGAYFGVDGTVPTIGSSASIALVVQVTDTTAGSPIFGTNTYTIILGDQNTGSGFNPVVSGQFTSFTQFGNSFEAAGVTIFGSNLTKGDTFTINAALTVYADPASIDVLDISNFPSLAADLPDFAAITGIPGAVVPEPASVVLAGWRPGGALIGVPRPPGDGVAHNLGVAADPPGVDPRISWRGPTAVPGLGMAAGVPSRRRGTVSGGVGGDVSAGPCRPRVGMLRRVDRIRERNPSPLPARRPSRPATHPSRLIHAGPPPRFTPQARRAPDRRRADRRRIDPHAPLGRQLARLSARRLCDQGGQGRRRAGADDRGRDGRRPQGGDRGGRAGGLGEDPL